MFLNTKYDFCLMVSREKVFELRKTFCMVKRRTHEIMGYPRNNIGNEYLRFLDSKFFLKVGRFWNILLIPNHGGVVQRVGLRNMFFGGFNIFLRCHS